MPYIAPNTKLYILKGVPLDNTYEHTVYYANATAQLNAFLAYKKYELEKLSYQRTGAGLMRVQLTYEQMYDCNYMIFQNTSYGNKWWYAFITGVAYVNNSTCEISYEIDVMQTWCYDYTFMQSFVDREHVDPSTESFTNFKNYTQPEGLETGAEPIRIQKQDCGGKVKGAMLLATTWGNGNSASVEIVNNSLTSLFMQCWDVGENFNSVHVENLIATIQGYINNGFGENIISLQSGPCDGTEMDSATYVMENSYSKEGNLAGYAPKNPKLLCYPFHYYTVSNQEGQSIIIKPELSHYNGNYDIAVRFCGYLYPSPVGVIYPIDYNNTVATSSSGAWTDADHDMSIDYALYINDYPTFAIANDSYKAWWAQNKNSYLASQGNITRSYNTEMANIGNSYAQQMVASQNSVNNANLSALTTANNANRSNQTNFSNQTRSNFVSGAESLASGLGSLLDLDFSGVASGAMGAVHAGINQMNNRASMQTNEQNIAASLATATTIAGNNYSTAKTLAELSRQANSLSALTNNQNATASLVAKKQDMLNAPDGSIGAISGNAYRQGTNNYGFIMFEVCARPEYLKMADNYFEKYGYKIASMSTPSHMNGRPYWHYLQTTGCNIKGNFNVTDISAIKTIYNNGITTWNALENVGNYNLNNHTSASTLSER